MITVRIDHTESLESIGQWEGAPGSDHDRIVDSPVKTLIFAAGGKWTTFRHTTVV